MRLMAPLMVVVISLFVCNTQAFAKSLVAKKAGVKVLAESNQKAPVLKTLAKDEVVESGERQGMFWSVKTDKGNGFVSVLDVKPQSEEASGLASAIRSAVQSRRSDDDSSNVRARSAVMGVRGLDESSETAFAGNVRPNLRMVYNMEGYAIPMERIDFLGEEVAKEISTKLEK